MATIQGTTGNDKVTVNSGDTYNALEGDDDITLMQWASANPGKGNDTVRVVGGVINDQATVQYWGAPGSIEVDLEAGYALDGHGTKDILINVRNVHGFNRSGDKGFGSSESDFFWTGLPWQSGGKSMIDGRGGNDTVTVGYKTSDAIGQIFLTVSEGGQSASFYFSKKPEFVFELKNIEVLRVRNWEINANVEYDLKEMLGGSQSKSFLLKGDAAWANNFIDLTQAGSEFLLRGTQGWQTGVHGSSMNLTYSFMTQMPGSGAEGGTGFVAFSPAQQQVVRDIFNTLQLQTGLTFTEASGDLGQLKFGINQQLQTRGYSFLPAAYKGDARAGDVWMDVETMQLIEKGQEGFYVLLHEIGHALGLQHPLTVAEAGNSPVLVGTLTSQGQTLMTDISASTLNEGWPTWFGGLDLQALRTLYGSKPIATGNDAYVVTNATAAMTILDEGGVDTLDFSQVTLSVFADLREGKFSSAGVEADGTSKYKNIMVSNGSLIEHVTGTPYDDVVFGNSQNNVITFMGGNDIVDGQGGMDTLRLWSNASEFRISKDTASNAWNVEALNNISGSIELQNMERIYFADKAWALDMGANENAGRTAKILGALFGKEGLSYPSFRGIGLYFLDSGVSYEALMGAAVDTRLSPGASKADVANVLMANVPGLVLDPNAYANTTAMALAAADSELNKSMINLVGLASTGFDYIILG
jgi:hypothetical protein